MSQQPFPASQPFNTPPQAPQQKSFPLWGIVLIIFGILLVAGLVCLGVLGALMAPAIVAAQTAAKEMALKNNMKQIGLALHNYHSAYNQFPAAYTVDSNGKPLHSWRTSILPFMERNDLAERVAWDKPWDHPDNAFLMQEMPMEYHSPLAGDTESGLTTMVAVIDPSSIFEGSKRIRFRDVLDGAANTVLFTETSSIDAVPWAAPEDIDMAIFAAGFEDDAHPTGHHVCMADGFVTKISNNISPEDRQAFVTRAGSETVFLKD
ncbi:MAG: DUF1559 domain-containing protein [Planctomycetota bacterium]